MTVQIGIQLYSVRDSLARDPEGTLARLAELGFTRIEGANHQALTDPGIGFGITAERLRTALDRNGLQLVGSHINPLDPEILGPVLDFHASIGNPAIACDIEFYPYGDLDYVRRRADVFTRVGEMCAERGMVFAYHNHFQEFQEFGGATVYEHVLENTDPALVKIEMDTFWMYRAGQDPLEWIRRYGDRVILSHQKDFPAGLDEPLNLYEGVVAKDAVIDMDLFEEVKNEAAFTEIGTGILPIQDIIDALDALPAFRFLLLEQDHSALDELESVARSRAAFDRYANISFSA
ncbi:sugar phosphate isomerase/epimerase family protein [Microbacterium sp. NPDC008134]|jgi:sugar phosphate isomerase/epimerase|uniref:sugar phosphate isomerase/epimerase family protein n=1 Tax=Microbacterium sp. NPDC008134 TaxID=3364183 RepID=UPI0036E73E60